MKKLADVFLTFLYFTGGISWLLSGVGIIPISDFSGKFACIFMGLWLFYCTYKEVKEYVQ